MIVDSREIRRRGSFVGVRLFSHLASPSQRPLRYPLSERKERTMHVTIARAAGVLLAAVLAAAPMAVAQTAPAPSAERSRTEGLKETDRFVKAGNHAYESIGNAHHETKNTLAMYNNLVTQPSKNMKSD